MLVGMQDRWVRSAAALIAGLAVSACASSRPAPIIYGGSAIGSPVRTPAPSPIPRPPIAAPLDLAALPYDPADPPLIVEGMPELQCVPYARQMSGIAIWGDAVTWWAQAENRYVRSAHPVEGSVFVMRGYNDDSRGHVSYVSAIVSDRVIKVDHANWMGRGETSIHVPVVDVSPNNDWSEIRVWHIPGNHWGGRTYQAEGFIHPFRLDGSAGLISD